MATQEDWVEVLVPRRLVPNVYGLIAEQMATGSTNGGPPGSDDMTERMYLESPPAMRTLLMLLANNAGTELSAAEICKAMDLTPAQFAGVLGAFGHRRKNRYPGAKKPFAHRWDHGKHSWMYRMDAEVAELAKKAAEAEGK